MQRSDKVPAWLNRASHALEPLSAGLVRPASTARRRFEQVADAVYRDPDASIDLTPGPAPTVTAIVVAFGQPHLTFLALASLFLQRPARAEVILVDNGSGAEFEPLFSRLRGVRILRNDRNIGYVDGMNAAAADVSTRYVAQVNSDCFLLPGALCALEDALNANTAAGIAGGRVLLPSGRLQEAGCRVWRDGTTDGIGRGRLPDASPFLAASTVDYVSGTAALVRTSVWQALDGLSEDFSPGYYDDADLSFRAAANGWQTLYVPGCRVLHLEHGSSSKRKAIKTIQRHRARFAEKHREALALKRRTPILRRLRELMI